MEIEGNFSSGNEELLIELKKYQFTKIWDKIFESQELLFIKISIQRRVIFRKLEN